MKSSEQKPCLVPEPARATSPRSLPGLAQALGSLIPPATLQIPPGSDSPEDPSVFCQPPPQNQILAFTERDRVRRGAPTPQKYSFLGVRIKYLYEKIGAIAMILGMIITTTNAQSDESFMTPPRIIKNPSSVPQYSPESRKFTGISSLAISHKGSMWAVWYAGKTRGEDLNNYVVVARSEDGGTTWTEILIIDPDGDGPVRAFDPEVWIDPNEKLWIFWAQVTALKGGTRALLNKGTLAGVWALTTGEIDEKNPAWDVPRRLTDGVMLNKPIILSSSEWMLPVSMWMLSDNTETDKTSRAIVSTDNGKTWNVRGSVGVPKKMRNFDENMIVERKDGSLWMLIRTKYGIGESISNDKGSSWSSLVPSRIQHPVARFFIRRLSSGNLLLVKHGPIDMQIGRSHLMAFVSKDDGLTWSNGLLLDERPGVSYPDGQQAKDGTIYITYDFDRGKSQNILLTSFTEEDVISGSDRKILEVFRRRRIISQGGVR